MRIRATKMITGNDRIFQASVEEHDGDVTVVVEGIGPVSAVEFFAFGFKIEDAVTDEIEKLKRSPYREWGRIAYPFEKD